METMDCDLPPKIPVVLLMLAIYNSSVKRERLPYTQTMLVMLTFVAFNSVFYPSYMIFLIPFIPLAATEVMGKRESD